MKNEIAVEILRQLGGHRFLVMTGARDLVAMENGMLFKLPSNRARKGINYVKIVLNGADTYDVTFYKVRGFDMVEVGNSYGIYNDGLAELFENETGLYTSLGSMQGGAV